MSSTLRWITIVNSRDGNFVTGIVGVPIGHWLLGQLGVNNPAAKGLAVGLVSHSLGKRGVLFFMSEVAAAFAGLAMGLNALVTAVLLSLLRYLLI